MEELPVRMSGYVEPRSRRGYVDTSVGQIHYRTVGEGRPLVLLHQTPSSSVMWERFMKSFPDHYRLVAFDSPGFGMSDEPSQPLTMADFAATIFEAMSQLSIDSAMILGHHTGASIAIEMARQDRSRVSGLVLMGPFAPPTATQLQWWKNLVHRWQPDAKGEFLAEAVLPRLNSVAGESDAQEYLSELIAHLQAGPNYWWAYDAVFAYQMAAVATEIEVPTLVLTGERELPDQEEMARLVHSLIVQSKYAVVLGGTSQMVSQIPERVRDIVVPFIDGVLGLN